MFYLTHILLGLFHFANEVSAFVCCGCEWTQWIFECPAALAEEDESLLAVDDTMFAAVDGRRGSPSITRKHPLPMLASIMAVGSLRETWYSFYFMSTKAEIRNIEKTCSGSYHGGLDDADATFYRGDKSSHLGDDIVLNQDIQIFIPRSVVPDDGKYVQ